MRFEELENRLLLFAGQFCSVEFSSPDVLMGPLTTERTSVLASPSARDESHSFYGPLQSDRRSLLVESITPAAPEVLPTLVINESEVILARFQALRSRGIGVAPLEPPESAGDAELGPALGPYPNTETFKLHSKPGSNYTIYLDFDGHVTEGTTWNQPNQDNMPTIVHPAYDRGGTPGVFSQLEHDLIQAAWQRVAEDFAPFDVNVTTEDPGVEALRKDDTGTDTQWGVRVVMTTDTWASCGCGGFAYLGSFEDATDEPSFVFNNSLDGVSETISHEVGHQLNLGHDGVGASTYYAGHGGTGPTSWGAIMGGPFSQEITQWDHGEYFNASNPTEDDLAVITTTNGFGYRADDFGDIIGTAGSFNIAGGASVSAFGIIEQNTDVDYFRFETGTGNVSFSLTPHSDRPDLDIWAGIYNSTGTLLNESNPSNSTSASFTNVALAAGTYYLKIDGVGTHGAYNAVTDTVDDPTTNVPWKQSSPTGYSDYGSLGQYAISGTIVVPSSNQFSVAALSADKREGNTGTTNFTFTVTRSGNTLAAGNVDYRVVPTRQKTPSANVEFTVDGSDFVGGTLPDSTVSFLAGQVSKTLTISVVGDTDFERDEEFAVILENLQSGWGFSDSRATGLVQGDESQAHVMDGVQFRWRQQNFNKGNFDHFAIDNVSVSNTTFTDDFDPAIDNSQWDSIVGASATNTFGGSGNGLFFNGSSIRTATTIPLDVQAGDQFERPNRHQRHGVRR